MAAIERSEEFYTGVTGPLYAVHFNGSVFAIFSGANEALAYWRGLDAEGRRYFHIEDAECERVTVKDQPGHPGHAYAILEALDRAPKSDQ